VPSSDADTCIISLTDVSLSYARGPETVHAVRRVTWQVPSAHLAVITGASGSGKTTLLNLMAGIERPHYGAVTVLGEGISEWPERERAAFRLKHIGVVFQDHNLVTEFSAVENVELPLVLSGMSRAAARAEAEQALERVGLSGEVRARPQQMSGGQRQRVGLARALAGERKIVLADEPTGSVDAATANDIFQRLRDLAEGGLTVVLVTHDQRAVPFGHSVLVMVDGEFGEAA